MMIPATWSSLSAGPTDGRRKTQARITRPWLSTRGLIRPQRKAARTMMETAMLRRASTRCHRPRKYGQAWVGMVGVQTREDIPPKLAGKKPARQWTAGFILWKITGVPIFRIVTEAAPFQRRENRSGIRAAHRWSVTSERLVTGFLQWKTPIPRAGLTPELSRIVVRVLLRGHSRLLAAGAAGAFPPAMEGLPLGAISARHQNPHRARSGKKLRNRRCKADKRVDGRTMSAGHNTAAVNRGRVDGHGCTATPKLGLDL